MRVLLIFGVIAFFVAALVISNTFSILVAQNTRRLALLRCLPRALKRSGRSSAKHS